MTQMLVHECGKGERGKGRGRKGCEKEEERGKEHKCISWKQDLILHLQSWIYTYKILGDRSNRMRGTMSE